MIKFAYSSVLILFFCIINVPAYAAEIDLISVSSSGVQGNSFSNFESISTDGQFMTFSSVSRNLHTDTTDGGNIFIHDRINGTTELVSIATDGTQGDSYSNVSSVSADGRFVAFTSEASNLVNEPDIAINRDVFLRDVQLGITTRINPPGNPLNVNTASVSPSISADGRFTAFATSNFTPDSSPFMVYDRITDTLESVEMPIHPDPRARYSSTSTSISADGNYVVFYSSFYIVENNVIVMSEYYVHLYDRILQEVKQINGDVSIRVSTPVISNDGQTIAYLSADDYDLNQVLIYDHKTGTTKGLDNVAIHGISQSSAGYDGYFGLGVSGNGRFIVFGSEASNLVEDDTNDAYDIFVYDQQAQITKRVNVNPDDSQATNTYSQNRLDSSSPSISSDGEFIGFTSELNTLVDSDTNNTRDSFLAKNPLIDINYDLSVTLNSTSGSVAVGEYTQFRAKFTNNSSEVLTNCKALLVNPKINHQREFSYFTWPLNQPSPAQNAGIDLAPGETGLMQLAVLPRVALRKEIRFNYICDNDHNAYTIPFVNTVHLNAKTEPLIAEDFLQIENANNLTSVVIDRSNGKYWTPVIINVSNTGSEPTSATIIATSDLPDSILRESKLCEPIDPASGNWTCISTLDTQVQVELAANETKKVKVFLHARQEIDQMPIANRVYVEARDSVGDISAKHSIGVSAVD